MQGMPAAAAAWTVPAMPRVSGGREGPCVRWLCFAFLGCAVVTGSRSCIQQSLAAPAPPWHTSAAQRGRSALCATGLTTTNTDSESTPASSAGTPPPFTLRRNNGQQRGHGSVILTMTLLRHRTCPWRCVVISEQNENGWLPHPSTKTTARAPHSTAVSAMARIAAGPERGLVTIWMREPNVATTTGLPAAAPDEKTTESDQHSGEDQPSCICM